ncbi:MAG: LPS export ABC transporter permease LptF [Robiginitomaculum sp.]|nr:MAG: LPS export ABC transporter permease LptF [Robiginitomaculum sp.]
MKTLQSYFIRETFRPFVLTTLVLGALALLTQSLAALDMIVDDRASFLAYLEITLLALPQLVSIILPFALFIAVAYAVQRLHTDNEFMVAFAGGMTRWAVITPILRIAVLAVLVNLVVNTWAQPTAYKAMREIIYKVRTDLAASIIRPGEFVTPALNLTIFARDVQNGVLSDVMIHDGRDHKKPHTYFAKSGVFVETQQNPALSLTNVTRQSISGDGALEILEFSRTTFELRGVIEPQGALLYKRSDRYLGELFHPDPTNYWDRENTAALYAEGHARLSAPLYNIAFALLALVALLGGDYSRMGYGRRLMVAGSLALFVRLVGFSIEAASAEIPVLNLVQYALPVLLGSVSLWLVLDTSRLRKPAGRLAAT